MESCIGLDRDLIVYTYNVCITESLIPCFRQLLIRLGDRGILLAETRE